MSCSSNQPAFIILEFANHCLTGYHEAIFLFRLDYNNANPVSLVYSFVHFLIFIVNKRSVINLIETIPSFNFYWCEIKGNLGLAINYFGHHLTYFLSLVYNHIKIKRNLPSLYIGLVVLVRSTTEVILNPCLLLLLYLTRFVHQFIVCI